MLLLQTCNLGLKDTSPQVLFLYFADINGPVLKGRLLCIPEVLENFKLRSFLRKRLIKSSLRTSLIQIEWFVKFV